jgi:pimeloyl-ACP methyl ester carboxylesterase
MKDSDVERPETLYAWNGDVALAYQVVGEGRTDLLYLEGLVLKHRPCLGQPIPVGVPPSPLAQRPADPLGQAWLGKLRSVLSPNDVPPFETLTDDIMAVLDAVGSEKAVVFATNMCSILAVLFAATYPDRVSALILCDPLVNLSENEDAPGSLESSSDCEDFYQRIRQQFPQPSWWEGPEDHPERDWFSGTSVTRLPLVP